MALLFTLHTQTHRSYIYSFQSFCIILFRYFLYRIHFFVRNSMVWKTRCWCTDVYAFTEMNSSETHKTLIMHANKIVCGCMCKRFSWREQTTQFWISILRTKKKRIQMFYVLLEKFSQVTSWKCLLGFHQLWLQRRNWKLAKLFKWQFSWRHSVDSNFKVRAFITMCRCVWVQYII